MLEVFLDFPPKVQKLGLEITQLGEI